MQRQWCKVAGGTIVVAPGGITAGETEADGWVPVVDTGPGPAADQLADEMYVVHPDRVQRTWVNVRERPETANRRSVEDLLINAIDGLRAYAQTPTPTNAQTVSTVKLLARAVAALLRAQRGDFTEAP